MTTLNQPITTFSGVIDAFGGPSKYADAIRIPGFHAQSMKTRDSIPSPYWSDTVSAAARLVFVTADEQRRRALESVTLAKLAEIAKVKRPQPEAASQ